MNEAKSIRAYTPTDLPPRRYLTRREAAQWLGLSVDTFDGLGIPFVDFGPRNHRWDTVDINAWAEQNKVGDSARASKAKRRYADAPHAWIIVRALFIVLP